MNNSKIQKILSYAKGIHTVEPWAYQMEVEKGTLKLIREDYINSNPEPVIRINVYDHIPVSKFESLIDNHHFKFSMTLIRSFKFALTESFIEKYINNGRNS